MNTKLTLSLDEDVIKAAKRYAKQHKVSLSKMIENLLRSISHESIEAIALTPIVAELSSLSIKSTDKPYKDIYKSYIDEKYKNNDE